MYFFRGRLLRNFFTSFVSSIFSPNEAALDEISDNLPTKSSIVSVSFIFKRSNSAISVCRRASRTLSAPMCLAFIASQTCLAELSSPTCKINTSGIDWKSKAVAKLFFSISDDSSSITSHTLCTFSKTLILIAQTV